MTTRIRLTATILIAIAACTVRGQPKSSDLASRDGRPRASDTTPLTTDLPANTRKSREQLVQSIERLLQQIQVTDELLDALQKNNDGSRETRSKICLLALLKEQDRAAMTTPVAASLEHLRFAMDKEALGLHGMAKRRDLDVQATQMKIERTADKILAQEEQISQIADPDERQAAEQQVGELKLEMQEQIKLRDDRSANVKDYQKAAADLQNERKSLQAIERLLARETRLAAIRVDRLSDAVQHGMLDALRHQSDEERKTLQSATDLIRKIQNATVNMPLTLASSSSLRVDPTKPELAQAALPSYQVEAELKKARERRKTGN